MNENHDQRPVYRCMRPGCGLVQYRAANGLCRKCGKPYETDQAAVTAMPDGLTATRRLPVPAHIYSANIGRALRTLRLRAGFSQRRLAQAAGVYRSRLTKIEAGLLVPSIATVESMVAELRIDLLDVLMMIRKQADARTPATAGTPLDRPGVSEPLEETATGRQM